ncbi:uncharacterized protein J3D65DRAFT_281873 [Phyllosticta citribraziliensis]|uniref:Uncharacterized protein n=1 Tax=Phyllosticta citribraziliensis TaxID=989973 RepID=A0ABR1LXM4_9PEZI
MAYHQAHLLMLAGYSSFFVSGLVLPKAEYPHPEEDHDVTMTEDDMEVDPSVVPQELNEAPVPSAPCSSVAASSASVASKAAPLPSALNGTSLLHSSPQGRRLTLLPVEKRRKRSLFADQSHVRTISRWLCETQPQCQAAEDRPRQNSMPDMSPSVRIPSPPDGPDVVPKNAFADRCDPFRTASRLPRDQAFLRWRPSSPALHPDHRLQGPGGVNHDDHLIRVA